MHRDRLGQEIKVGSKILWSANGSYSGFEQGILEVISLSAKCIRAQRTEGDERNRQKQHTIHPRSVVVVDMILDSQEEAAKAA